MKNLPRLLIMISCICGIALSIASLHSHYAISATDYCDLNEMFNCDIVNRSKFSELFGVPVALIGLLGYVVLLGISTKKNRVLDILRFLMSLVGLVFALYLAYIEEFVLRTWCLLCIGSLISISAIAILSAVEIGRREPQSHQISTEANV